jgi:hypothetical protein
MRALVLLALVGLASPAARAAAQDPPPQIWNGVFSQTQADRGRPLVTAHCTQCHGQGRALNDEVFMLHWEGHDLARLFRKIRDTMPPGRNSGLTNSDKLDILAFMLQQNGFPAGAHDLAEDEIALREIRILPRGGPRPMQSGAVVQVTGCLAQPAAYQWQLTSATEPAPATLEDTAGTPGDADLATATGSQTFQLLNPFPSPATHVGRQVLVKGLLIRNPAGDRINVVRLEPLAATCAP